MTLQRSRPRLMILDDPGAVDRRVAELIADLIREKPECVLGLATGGTPVGAYRELVGMHQQQSLDFSRLTTFNLDEYVGLSGDHPQSYRYFMQHHLFDHVNVQPSRTHVPNGRARDIDREAREYEKKIDSAGGIDLQLLGIGSNGHIAFNEPGSPIESRTRTVELTAETIEDNARFFETADEVPGTAITMGIGTILESKRIVLMATGDAKADAVRTAVEDDPDPINPASLLQLHSNVTFVLDRAAAGGLSTSGSR